MKLITNPIKINGETILFSSCAEHVGILRSTCGNEPAIMARLSAHRNALSGILHEGLAKNHRGNPYFSLKLEKLYALSVLLSGLASLVLSVKDFSLIDSYYRECLQKLLRLHTNTPRSVIFFLAGSLPASAFLHQRQLNLFGMVSRLENNILYQHAQNIFTSATISKGSWFHQIRNWCIKYNLPHPASIIEFPPDCLQWKKLVKSKVVSYWEVVLREEVKSLKSLCYFKPKFMSLTQSHSLFFYAGHSPINVAKASVQSIMLSGR